MVPKVSGLYKTVSLASTEAKAKGTELELRVDVDSERPMNVISGDLYSNSGRSRRYLSSFRFEEVEKVRTVANEILIIGKAGKFYPDLRDFANIQVTIPLDSYPLKAAVKWINKAGAESKYLCKHKSEFFRSVQVEHDYEEEVVPFESYDTKDLFSPSPHRSQPLSISDAFAEAGIKMVIVKKKQNFVPHPKGIPGDGSVWTDSDLYDAMLKHFSMFKETPQWKVWLFSAKEYVISDTKGIMVAHNERKRRGCAVFQDAIGWQSPLEKRMLLFIYIHELGHCFNLHHPWSGMPADTLTGTGGQSTLSWMNYPWRYYSSDNSRGEEAFWKKFNFQFSDSELIHLRHGFRNDVIFGGTTSSEETDLKFI